MEEKEEGLNTNILMWKWENKARLTWKTEYFVFGSVSVLVMPV